MSLYRKYRPKVLADVIGQDHVVPVLENAVQQGKLTHAYLFAGPRGTGKTSVARILAKTMLTHGMEDHTLAQKLMEAVDDGSLVDLVEIDAASNRGIDDIRSLVEKIQFSPVVGKAKVYIIDEVHMLTREAFNALLKTLEEPPSYAFFILATTELQKIPATIQSRCQRFAFRQIREEDIIRGLQKIVDAERIPVDRPALRAIAHHAQGGLRDAISLLDQLRSLPKIGLEDVQEKIGESGQEFVEGVFSAVETGNKHSIIDIVRKVEQGGIPLDVFARQLLTEARTRLHAAVEKNEPINALSDVLSHMLTVLRDIRISPVPGLAPESALLALCADSETEPEAHTKRLFRRKMAEVKATKTEKAETPKETSPEEKPETAIVQVPELSLESVQAEWPAVLRAVEPAWVRMSLKNGHVHAIKGSTIIISFPSAFHRDKVSTGEGIHKVEEALHNIMRRDVKIDCIIEQEGHAQASAKQEMVNLAEAASEVF